MLTSSANAGQRVVIVSRLLWKTMIIDGHCFRRFSKNRPTLFSASLYDAGVHSGWHVGRSSR
jgi:hypothetical protein